MGLCVTELFVIHSTALAWSSELITTLSCKTLTFRPLYQNQKTISNYSLVYVELHSSSSYFDHGLKTAPFQQRETLLTVYSRTWRGRASGNELLIGDDIPLKTDKVCCSETSNASTRASKTSDNFKIWRGRQSLIQYTRHSTSIFSTVSSSAKLRVY